MPWGTKQPDAMEKKEKKVKRRVVSLEDLRKEYQGVLDRVGNIESGKFEFGAFGEDEEDGEEGEGMDVS